MKIKHLLFLIAMLGMFSFTSAQVQTIIDNTIGTATNDGTVNVGEYVGFSIGINSGFGNIIGSNSQIHIDTDNTGNLNFGFISGNGNFFNSMVIYIDAGPGGLPNTTQFTDNGDGGRAMVSAIGFNDPNGRADIFFADGFEADYAIAVDANFAGIFQLVGGGSHNYMNSANLNPTGNGSAGNWEMNLMMSDIGLAPGSSFKYVISYGNQFDGAGLFRSDEFHGVDPSTVPPGNIGINPVTLAAADYIQFYSYAPATSTWTHANFSEDWFDYLNWNNGVPGRFTDVTIPTGVDGYPWLIYDSKIAECNDLLIGSDALIVADQKLVVYGTSTVQRDYTGGEWHFISSPVEGEDVSIFLTDPPSIYLRSFES
jgi:hypothetical protein